MRSDCASVPTRGSRFAGPFSIIITNVSGAGCGEQESNVPAKAMISKISSALHALSFRGP